MTTFLDLPKAFDSMDRKKAKSKIRKSGIKKTKKLRFNHFQNRLKTVSMNRVNSDSASLDYEVVQRNTAIFDSHKQYFKTKSQR